MRLIEFAIETNPNTFSPSVILIDTNDISTFEQIAGQNDKCKLITKHKIEYIVYGTYKTLTSRFLYALTKKNNIHEDDVIRPSIRVYYRHSSLEIDVAFFDKIQLKAFIFGLVPDFNLDLLPEYTREIFNQ